jgi:hypothetical protein
MWFAKKLPGPPVEMNVEKGGEVVSRMSLLRYRDGFEEPTPAAPEPAAPDAPPPSDSAPEMLAPGLR